MKYFYEEVVLLEKVPLYLAEKIYSVHEHAQLLDMARETVHHKIMDMIMDELEEENKHTFLILLESEQSPTLIEKLKYWVNDIEHKIRLTVNSAEEEIIVIITQNER